MYETDIIVIIFVFFPRNFGVSAVQEKRREEEGKGEEERRRRRKLASLHFGWSKGDQPPERRRGQIGLPRVLMTVKFW